MPELQKLNKDFRLLPVQQEFLLTEARRPAFVGSWGTGKTMTNIFKVIREAEKYPDNLILVGRKERVNLDNSTIADFRTYTNNFQGMKWREQKKELTLYFADRAGNPYSSTIIFRHVDEFPAIQNMNLGYVFLEQADELEDDGATFDFISGRLRRKNTSRTLAISANATSDTHWIYKYYKTDMNQDDEQFKLFEACSLDNRRNLPKDTLDDWERLRQRNPQIYRRYVLNEWGVSDNAFILMPSSLLSTLPVHIAYPWKKRVVAVDPASGGDTAVIYLMENFKVMDALEEFERDTMKLASKILIFCNKHKEKTVAIDTVGMGGPVADRLKELGLNVIRLHSAERSSDPNRYLNKRAEMWWDVAEAMKDGRIPAIQDHNEFTGADEIKRQVASVRYEVNSRGKVKIEDKKKVRARLGRSPDNADTYVYGTWATLKHIKAQVSEKDDYREKAPVDDGSSWMSA